MRNLDIQRLRLASTSVPSDRRKPRVPRHRRGELFLRGPIPWNWLVAAARLPGRALAVAIVLWFEAGVKGAAVVALSQKRLRDLGVKRHAGYRGLTSLEESGLVSVQRHPGRLSVVTLRGPVDSSARGGGGMTAPARVDTSGQAAGFARGVSR